MTASGQKPEPKPKPKHKGGKWDHVVSLIPAELKTWDFRPALRTLFYRLFDKHAISNTGGSYDQLGKKTVKARMDGRLPLGCFSDSGRQLIANFKKYYFTPEELLDARVKSLKETPENYIDSIPRWHNQPHYVEVWIEKDAMVGTFKSYLKDKDVGIMPNRGLTSLTALSDFRDRVVEQLRKNIDIQIHILYYGDFDPSGDLAVSDLISRLGKIPLLDSMDKEKDPDNWVSVLGCISFEHVAVTKDQVERFKLPSEIDEKTRQKLEGYWKPDGTWKKPDPNTARFIAKHGRLYANELDSLPSRIPDEFKKMVIESVDQYYDETIYQALIDEYAAVYEETREALRDKVRLLDARLLAEKLEEDEEG